MKTCIRNPLSLALSAALGVTPCGHALSAPLNLSQVPLFVTTGTKANVLLILGNSNAMDEDPTGLAVGSANSSSRSEIARTAARSLVSNYTGQINMGLMAYQQSNVVAQWLNQSPYDISYDPAHYDPSWTGARDSATHKKFKLPNPTSPNPTGACTTGGGVKVDCVYYNVNLPYYTSGPQGNSFCYSRTTGGSPYVTFPGDHTSDYYCYSIKTGTSNGADNVVGSGYSGLINGTPWSFVPTDSDFAQAIDDFGNRNASFDSGPTWFSNGSPGLGYLHVPIANLDSTQAQKLNTKLATSVVPTYSGGAYNTNPTGISGGNTWNNPNAPLINAGLTPITGTFQTAKSYFNGTSASFGANQGGPQPAPPNACGNDFVVFLTTGLPSVTASGGSVQSQYSAGIPYAPAETNNAITEIGNLNSGSRPVKTYVIGFALPEFTNNYFISNPPNPLDQMAAAGGTTSAHYANNLTSLNSTFSTIFSSIVASAGAAAAVAMTSGSVSAGGKIYQGRFNSADWSGDLVAYNTNPSTGAVTTTAWNAGTVLNTQNYNSGRNIITYKPSNAKGIPFRWPVNAASPTSTELDVSQTNALTSNPSLNGSNPSDTGLNRLNYLRGQTGISGFRPRLTSVLGDIVNSAPAYVGPPAFDYADSLESSAYSAFRSTFASRSPMIYVGANDGMLHAFDATTGQEKLAYVPSAVYSNLAQLTTTNYNNNHRYYVDASPTVVDAFFNGGWHTMLVGGLGAGGRGVYALDVTNPASFNESNATSIVKWEFVDSDVGYVAGQPSIVKLNAGNSSQWAAVFSNGYNSTTGIAALYIVDIETGALIKKISTGAGSASSPNALASPTLLDVDANGTVDYAYAGDLQGNMWKFDLCNATNGVCANNNSGWGVTKLFLAKDGLGNAQPITSAVEVTRHFSGDGYQLYFGTGKYLESGDITSTGTQTFYSLWDRFSTAFGVSDRSNLSAKSIASTTTVGGTTYRITSGFFVNWASPAGPGTERGWYLDLTPGERVVSDPALFSGRILFTTMIPNSAACANGGTGWLMELDAVTGAPLTGPTFDVDGDGDVDTNDNLGSPGLYPAGVAKSSIPSAVRLQKNPLAPGGGLMNKWTSMSQQNTTTGNSLENVLNSMPSLFNRASWRQIFE